MHSISTRSDAGKHIQDLSSAHSVSMEEPDTPPLSTVTASQDEETIMPIKEIQPTINPPNLTASLYSPTSSIAPSTVAASQDEETIMPIKEIQPTINPPNLTASLYSPTSSIAPSTVAASQDEETIMPIKEIQPTIYPTNLTASLYSPTSSIAPETENFQYVSQPNPIKPPLHSYEILLNFEKWLIGMDGGCQSPEIAHTSRLIISNLINVVGINNIMKPKDIYNYFESNTDIHASTTSVYLRYVSNFILFLRQEFPDVYSLEQHNEMVQRISK